MVDPFFMKGGFVLEGRDPFVLPEHFHIVFFIMEAAGICGFFDADITSLKEHLGNLNTAFVQVIGQSHAGFLFEKCGKILLIVVKVLGDL